jgi:hypothetical protein
MKNNLLLISLVGFLFVACNNSVIYDNSKDIEDGVWNVNDAKSFSVNIDDSLKAYNFFMKIKYPNGEISVDTIECFLADKTGKWLGSGIGKYRDNQIMIRQKGLFPMTGNYEFILQHGMRTEDGNISGIYSVGIRISEFKN